MHQKFLIIGRICCVLGLISGGIVVAAALFSFDLSGLIPAPIAYIMLLSVMAAVLCLLIGFAMDVMSHLMRHDLSAVLWLFAFTLIITIIQIVYGLINKQVLDYTMIFYTAFVISAGLRGFWYIIGIRGYEIEKYKNTKKFF